MWDPFRYKLGGRLLNGAMEEFTSKYGSDEDGNYVLARDLATYAIVKEVEAGRGSPHGGVYLSFEHCRAAALREAFGPVIDRLARERHRSHQNAGRSRADRALPHGRRQSRCAAWRRELPGLLSPARWSAAPTAPTGCPATPSPKLWCSAAAPAKAPPRDAAARRRRDRTAQDARPRHRSYRGDRRTVGELSNTAAMIARLQAVMADDVGPFRTGGKAARGRCAGIAELGQRARRSARPDMARAFDLQRLDWFDLRNMLAVAAGGGAIARSIAAKAAARISARISPRRARTGNCISPHVGATVAVQICRRAG